MMRSSHPAAAAALLFAPVALFAPKGEVPLLALCAALALASAEGRQAARLAAREPLAWALVAFMAWALPTAIWAPAPADAIGLWLRVAALLFAATVLAAAVARAAEASPLLRALPLGAALGLALAALELSAGNPIRRTIEGVSEDLYLYQSYWLNRGMTALALLAWPAAAALWPRSPRKAVALLAAAGLVLLAGTQMAAKLAFAVALAVAALAWLVGPRLRLGLAAFAFAICLGMPLAVGLLPDAAALQAQKVTGSISHRVQIWSFAVEKIAERPLAGWGFDASRAVPGGEAAAPGSIANLMPLHPHNGVLQVWLELGAPGALLLGALLAVAFWRAASLAAPPARAAATATVATALVIGCVSYGVWQTQWIAVLGFAAVFVAGAARAYGPGSCAA